MMAKVTIVTKILNSLLLIILSLATLGFLSFTNIYGVFWAIVTVVIAVGVYQEKRWAYFACAAWALACYQLAKQGYEFENIKRWVMILGFVVIGLAIYLHEKLGKLSSKHPQEENDKG
jgi:hypothetical protein